MGWKGWIICFLQCGLEKLEKYHIFVKLWCIVLDFVNVCNTNYQTFILYQLNDNVFIDMHCALYQCNNEWKKKLTNKHSLLKIG